MAHASKKSPNVVLGSAHMNWFLVTLFRVQEQFFQDDWKTLPPPVNLADYVNGFRRRLYEAVKQAKVQLNTDEKSVLL